MTMEVKCPVISKVASEINLAVKSRTTLWTMQDAIPKPCIKLQFYRKGNYISLSTLNYWTITLYLFLEGCIKFHTMLSAIPIQENNVSQYVISGCSLPRNYKTFWE